MSKEKLAFPAITIKQIGDSAYNKPTGMYHGGMTLRQYYAAKAMQHVYSVMLLNEKQRRKIKREKKKN